MNSMKFMQRDFSAILRVGQALISSSDNCQDKQAATKLVYGLATFVTEDMMPAVLRLAQVIDLETAIVVVARLGEEEFDWAKDLLYSVATASSDMNDAQIRIFNSLVDADWEYQPSDDNGSFDAYA